MVYDGYYGGFVPVDAASFDVTLEPEAVVLLPLSVLEEQRTAAKALERREQARAARRLRVVTREEILDSLWGVDYVAESNVVDRQIRNLRARLQNDWRKPRFIVTVPGRGYQFLSTLSEDAAADPAS
jgi:hypothetical protein